MLRVLLVVWTVAALDGGCERQSAAPVCRVCREESCDGVPCETARVVYGCTRLAAKRCCLQCCGREEGRLSAEEVHNRLRRMHGLSPLVWDEDTARSINDSLGFRLFCDTGDRRYLNADTVYEHRIAATGEGGFSAGVAVLGWYCAETACYDVLRGVADPTGSAGNVTRVLGRGASVGCAVCFGGGMARVACHYPSDSPPLDTLPDTPIPEAADTVVPPPPPALRSLQVADDPALPPAVLSGVVVGGVVLLAVVLVAWRVCTKPRSLSLDEMAREAVETGKVPPPWFLRREAGEAHPVGPADCAAATQPSAMICFCLARRTASGALSRFLEKVDGLAESFLAEGRAEGSPSPLEHTPDTSLPPPLYPPPLDTP